MNEKLDILILEDNADDAKLVVRALRGGGIDFAARRVETREDFLAALESKRPDVVLCDCKLPNFDGRSALKLAQERHPGTPVIMVTGTIADDDAVELLREGAVDYVLKDRLSRLAPAVRRALTDAQRETARVEAEEKYRALFERARDGIALIDFDTGKIADCNPEFERQTGRTLEELRQSFIWDLEFPGQVEAAREHFARVQRAGSGGDSQHECRRPDGTALAVELRCQVLELKSGRYLQSQVRDITQRVEAEARLRAQIDELRRFQKVTVDRELRMQELEEELRRLKAPRGA